MRKIRLLRPKISVRVSYLFSDDMTENKKSFWEQRVRSLWVSYWGNVMGSDDVDYEIERTKRNLSSPLTGDMQTAIIGALVDKVEELEARINSSNNTDADNG